MRCWLNTGKQNPTNQFEHIRTNYNMWKRVKLALLLIRVLVSAAMTDEAKRLRVNTLGEVASGISGTCRPSWGHDRHTHDCDGENAEGDVLPDFSDEELKPKDRWLNKSQTYVRFKCRNYI